MKTFKKINRKNIYNIVSKSVADETMATIITHNLITEGAEIPAYKVGDRVLCSPLNAEPFTGYISDVERITEYYIKKNKEDDLCCFRFRDKHIGGKTVEGVMPADVPCAVDCMTETDDELFARIAHVMLPLVYSKEKHDYESGYHPIITLKDGLVYIRAFTVNDEETGTPLYIALLLHVNTREGGLGNSWSINEFTTQNMSSSELFDKIKELINFFNTNWRNNNRFLRAVKEVQKLTEEN